MKRLHCIGYLAAALGGREKGAQVFYSHVMVCGLRQVHVCVCGCVCVCVCVCARACSPTALCSQRSDVCGRMLTYADVCGLRQLDVWPDGAVLTEQLYVHTKVMVLHDERY